MPSYCLWWEEIHFVLQKRDLIQTKPFHMCKNINPFFFATYPFSAWVWLDKKEDAPKMSRSVCFPLMKQTSESSRTPVMNDNFNTPSAFPRDVPFPGKCFTCNVECQWKERSNKTHVCWLGYKQMEGPGFVLNINLIL